jgi:signal transduction histidine kinase/CheY-like chemotaxis protein
MGREADRRAALGITAIFLAVGAVWIVFSDRFVARIVGVSEGAGAPGVPADAARLQTLKGILFLGLTSVLLYVLIRRGMGAVRAADERASARSRADEARYQDLVTQTTGEVARTRAEQPRLEEQLRQSQKMEAIGLLAGGLAHDFNNVLTAISGYTELAQARLPPDDPVRRELDGIHQATERATGLTRQLLAFSRRELLLPRPIDLNAVLTDMGRMLPRLLGEQVELVLRPEAGAATVLADLSQIEQVLLNLAVNARDAMPGGGRLLLQTADVPGDDRQAQGHQAPGRVALLVSDSGAGMDAATRAHIFEPFFTTKPTGQGTGLGLSTVYGIVQQSGGTIAVDSAPGSGTTFRIELPLVAAADAAAAAPAPAAQTSGGSETVLLVEDDDFVREMAQRTLARHGYSVLSARDAEEAGELLSGLPGPLHILVADVVMPGTGGVALAARLVRQMPALRVLLISGYGTLPDEAAALGAPLLTKPFTSLELAAAVRRALDSAPQRTAAGAAPAAAPTGDPLTVLVVDDDPQVRRVVRGLLETAGHRVLEAGNGNQALSVLRRAPADLVLCDMLMPEKEGLETCAELRRLFPELPFIGMSGAPASDNYLRVARKLGAAGTLSKPFSGQELLAAIAAARATARQGDHAS